MIQQKICFSPRGLPRLVQTFLVAVLLLGLWPATSHAAPNACPAAPGALPDVIERPTFCVYYNDSGTTAAQATTVADHTQAYWDLYVNVLGFEIPLFSGKLEVRLIDTTDCNGSTGSADNYMTVYDGCFGNPESIQKVVGHELFHRVQFAYDTDYAANWWMTEGTARAMEDNTFDNIDNWATSLTAVSSSFNKQVNTYLSNTNVDITSQPQRYNSALWWKYMTEQYGTTPGEPQLGVDALLRLWQAAETLDDIAAVNSALGVLGAGVNFDGAFRFFAAANWTKGLSNQPSPAYNYVDEDQVGNPAPYGPIAPTNGGTISLGTAANFTDQFVSRYGARYFRATPAAANCPVVSARFHTDANPVAGPAFYHVVAEKAGALTGYAQSTATDFTRAFFNDGLTSIVAIAGSTHNSAQVDVTLECVNPVIDIKLPNNVATAKVGPFNGPGKFLAQVLVTDGTSTGPVISGLTVNDFKVRVNGQNALITTGAFIQQQYWLLVQAPNQGADGVYNLEVVLEQSGTATTIATDTNLASIVYNSNNLDHVLVIDRSGSMLSDGKMEAAKQAARFYVDITRNNDGLAVAPYNENVNPASFDIRTVTAAPNVRQQAKDYISALSAGGLTSIGDGMAEAVNQRSASPTGNALCSFVLLSDGMENSAQFWAAVQASVQATGCPVTAIALGAASDETLMQNIATATGGIFFYNDVFVGAAAATTDSMQALDDTFLDLGNSYEYAQAQGEGRQRLWQEEGVISFGLGGTLVQTHTVPIDDSVREALFALDWVPGFALRLTLRKPDGTLITPSTEEYTFADFPSGHLGWRIANPEPGAWQMIVDFVPSPGLQAVSPAETNAPTQDSDTPYQVIVSGQSNLTAQLLLPDRLGSRFFTGNRLPIFALVSSDQPIGGLTLAAIVTAPDGRQTSVPMFDDGQHDDGEAGDGVYGGVYTLVNQAIQVAPTGEEPQQPPPPNDEGSYRVRLNIQTDQFSRQALGSFSVQEGPDDNSNGLPDPFEQENGVTGDGADPDLDELDNLSEYQVGTDPRNSDSDGGGQNDGSEISKGKNPLDLSDDDIEAPEFLRVFPKVGFNLLTYDVRAGYNRLVLFRAESPDGPWNVQQPELPLTGIYSDTATNNTTYYYRYMAIDGDDDRSAVIDTTPATPSDDPFPPEAQVLINDDAPATTSLTVTLSFEPYGHPDEEALQAFADISEMMLSNDPLLTGAVWQPFAQDIPWILAPTAPGLEAEVYAKFRDAAQNESLIVLDSILVQEPTGQPNTHVFLPLIQR